MEKVRRQVFETNSSSSHSISIADKNAWDYETIHPDEYGIITLGFGYFNFGYESYNDAEIKANYCAIDVSHDFEKFEMLKKVICEHTGAKYVAMDDSGYIDHQSRGTSFPAFESEETLKEFIFNPMSQLIIDNDNH